MRRSQGTLPGLRDKLPWPKGRPFRILSIDGGGICGILPAAILAEAEGRLCGEACAGDYFDLIAGTSTGGIIALGLSVGLPARRILDLYLAHGAEIFPRPSWDVLRIRRGLRFLRALGHHSYDPKPLKRELEATFGDHKLGSARRRLCVPSFDGFTEVHIFKTPHHKDFKQDWRDTLVTAGMATSAAPTFFPVYRDRGRVFADGGTWAANPTMVGLVDALTCHDLDRRDVHILSLGTGDSDQRITRQQILKGGVWHWRKIIRAAMHLQSQNAIGQAGLLVGRDHLVRLNAPPMPENPIEMDDYARASTELPPIARALFDEHETVLRERFFRDEAEPYRAFHGPRQAEAAATD